MVVRAAKSVSVVDNDNKSIINEIDLGFCDLRDLICNVVALAM